MADTPQRPERLDPALRKLIGVLLLGLVAVLLDTTIVNVAVDRLTRDLHTTVGAVQGVSTAFLLALALAIPLTAWAVGRVGAKRVWLTGLALFLVGSALAGCAWDISSLISFRVLQGLGGGLMLPVQQTLLVRAAGRERLGRVMAAIGLPAVVIPILGPVVGGLIVSNTSWRWVFFINVPISLAGLYAAWRGLAPDDTRDDRPLDVRGLALLAPGLAAVLWGLSRVASQGTASGWTAFGPVLGGLVLLAAFVSYALRTRRTPVMDVRLFAVRSFTASSALLFLTGLSIYGVALLLPLYYQQVRGDTALVAGLMLIPQGVGSLAARGTVGRLADRWGARPVVAAGVLVAVLGTVPYAWPDLGGEAVRAVGLVFRGVGLSAVNIAVMVAAYQDLRREQVPHGSSATRILMQVGGSFGVALAAVLLQLARTSGHGAATGADAYAVAFRFLLLLTAVAVVPALFVPRKDAPAPAPRPAAAEEPAGR